MTTVLIVEDEDMVAGAMERWLGGLGYDVTRAGTAEDALAIMKERHPRVAVCDVGLPGHDGLWLTDQLRHDHPDTAVILATGRDYLPAAATLRAGVVSYLVKPFGRDQLRAAVNDAVRWHIDATPNQNAERMLERAARECRGAFSERFASLHIETEADAPRALEMLFPDPAELEAGVRVAATADAIADHFEMSDADRAAVHWAARVHRLCRLTIPESILQKPEALSHSEMDIVKRAPSQVFSVLLDHPFLLDAAYLLRSIREREDGLGSPDRLVGADIPLGSRILAVAEAIEAMTHDQPHRPARPLEDVGVELRWCAGTQFDADVVRAAIEVMD